MTPKSDCQLCEKLIFSTSVDFLAGMLTIGLPSDNYYSGNSYCIVVSQSIPVSIAIDAPVTFAVGTKAYPLVEQEHNQVNACNVKARTKYPVIVSATPNGDVFTLIAKANCTTNANDKKDGKK